nr:autoinducer binding domain-containing protein [Paracoccus amoyensis]
MIDAVTVEDVQKCLFEAMASFGFQHTLYAARYLLELPTTVIHEELEVWSNFPDSFVSTLTSQKMLQVSYWAQWALLNVGFITTEEITRLHGPDTLSDFARDKGFSGGILFSLKGKVLRSNGAVWLNPGQDATTEQTITLWDKKQP